MAWPLANISLTNVDADSDSISSARADIYQAFTSLNDIIQVGPGSGSGGGGFTGNLFGNTLLDSVNGRILANASPQKTVSQIGTYTQAVVVNNTPSYISANLIPQNQSVALVTVANVNLLTTWANATLRTTNGTTTYFGVTATSANTAMNASDRVRALAGALDLNLNGKSWGTLTSASNTQIPIVTNGQTQNIYGTGSVGQAAAFAGAVTLTPVAGNINAQYVTSLFGLISYSTAGATYTASNINTARLVTGAITATANLTITNAIGLHTYNGWVSSNVSLVTNAYTILNEDARSIIQTNGNIVSTGTGNKYGTMTSFNEQVVALGSVSGTQSINMQTGSIYTMTLTGNVTINTGDITPVASGQSLTIVITQDGTGSRTLTTNIKFVGGAKTLSTAASAIDVVSAFYDGTQWLASLAKGFA